MSLMLVLVMLLLLLLLLFQLCLCALFANPCYPPPPPVLSPLSPIGKSVANMSGMFVVNKSGGIQSKICRQYVIAPYKGGPIGLTHCQMTSSMFHNMFLI